MKKRGSKKQIIPAIQVMKRAADRGMKKISSNEISSRWRTKNVNLNRNLHEMNVFGSRSHWSCKPKASSMEDTKLIPPLLPLIETFALQSSNETTLGTFDAVYTAVDKMRHPFILMTAEFSVQRPTTDAQALTMQHTQLNSDPAEE
jgi:hypothetical protein